MNFLGCLWHFFHFSSRRAVNSSVSRNVFKDKKRTRMANRLKSTLGALCDQKTASVCQWGFLAPRYLPRRVSNTCKNTKKPTGKKSPTKTHLNPKKNAPRIDLPFVLFDSSLGHSRWAEYVTPRRLPKLVSRQGCLGVFLTILVIFEDFLNLRIFF